MFVSLLVADECRAGEATVLEVENIVQAAKGGTAAWTPAANAQSLAIGDRVRTRQKSRATVKLTDSGSFFGGLVGAADDVAERSSGIEPDARCGGGVRAGA